MRLGGHWPAIRASLIALAIGFGLLDGCPLPPAGRVPAIASVERTRHALLRPVAWIGDHLDITQRWSLFTGASRKRFRLYVEGRTAAGDWRLLHRAADAAHQDYADILAYRRVRGVFSPRGQSARGQYSAFAAWMIRRVLADHPEFVVARTRLEHVVIDENGATPTGVFAFERSAPRSAP